TFKGPVQPSTVKLREELETVVADGPVLIGILEELGFRAWFRYEKYREEFALDDVIIAVDETPVGTFVEIEGGDRGIADMAVALGRGPAGYLLASYPPPYVARRQAPGGPPPDMGFRDPPPSSSAPPFPPPRSGRGARAAAAAADRWAPEARYPGGGRADDPPHHALAREPWRQRSRPEPALPARDPHRDCRRRQRRRCPRALFVGGAGRPRQRRRTA